LPQLRPDQQAIVNHPAKIKVVSMGRRWGKSFMSGTLALSVADHGGAVAWVVPTYKNARPTWRFCEMMTGPVAKQLKINRTERVIEFPSGGWLGVYSGDNDVSLRGDAFDLVIADEAARLSETTYTDVILPTLADRDGTCFLISTPRGRNWFFAEFVKAQGDGTQAAAFTAPSTANPMPTIKRAAERARELVSDRTYRQEWLAEFLDDGGGVFRRVREAATATMQDAALPAHSYIMGADWGRSNDATVLTVVDATTRQVCYVDRMLDTDYRLQTSRLRALAERFDVAQIVAEANSMGGPLVEQLLNEGLPVVGFTTTNASKALIIDALALAFERGELAILDDAQLIAELQAYEAERLPGGMVRYGAPTGMHDDHVISLALAWHGANVPSAERLFAFA
jgi:hypothetical protein